MQDKIEQFSHFEYPHADLAMRSVRLKQPVKMFWGRCKELESYLPLQIMEKAVIIFAENTKLAEFIIKHQVSNAEANSREQSLIAPLEDEEIITACTEYGGHLNVGWQAIEPSC